MSADPFSTGQLREQVLAAWTASPDRFREDANAEEDLALGGYRDRLVVELAQNAADAAARAGVAGRLLLRLAETPAGPLLVAANTGAPLDAAGVRALATLRASAKRDQAETATVGRFGVGFAAVLAVTDEPAVVSHGRGVRFSRADTLALVRAAAAEQPELAVELERRDEHVPVLRLPFSADGVAPTGYDTAVLLPLRDGAAADLAEHLLAAVDDALLLALPGLAEVVLERPGAPPLRLADVAGRWHTARREGVFAAERLADRPTEERRRPGWAVTWALPRDPLATADVPRVLHAPTPTDEPLDWPALLVATVPLDPTRRHVAAGPATDALVAEAAALYGELLADRAAAGDDVLPLVPTGLPAGALDGDLRAAAARVLPAAPLLAAVEDGARLRPRDAVALDGPAGDDPPTLACLAPVLAGLVAAPRTGTAALRALGVRRLALADVVDELPADPDPAVWRERYAGLAGLADDAVAREALAALPVPLVDGRVVRGVRGTTLPTGPVDAAALAPLAAHGLRLVHPDAVSAPAARRLLERLGATPAGPRRLLDDPAVASLVRAAAEDDELPDDEALAAADAVLALADAAVAAGELVAGDLAWLADLPLLDADGELAPAAALVLPGSVAARILDPDEVVPVADEVADRWGAEVLQAVGVAGSLALVRARDVDPADLPAELDDLDGAGGWADELGAGVIAEVAAVRDLDLVRDDAWPDALTALAADPALRAAVTQPVVVRTPDGTARRGRSYAAWWLQRRHGLARHADPNADPALAALLPSAPGWVVAADPALRAALGLARDWPDLDGEGWVAVLDALCAAGVEVDVVLTAWRHLADAATGGRLALDPPERLRALTGAGCTAVVDSAGAAVADAPMWLQRTDVAALVAVPVEAAEAVADTLDLDLASERADGRVAGAGDPREVPAAARRLLPSAPGTWREHARLRVDGADLDFWVDGEGPGAVVHAATLAGLARGLAQAAGQWARRLAVEAALLDAGGADGLLVEENLAGD